MRRSTLPTRLHSGAARRSSCSSGRGCGCCRMRARRLVLATPPCRAGGPCRRRRAAPLRRTPMRRGRVDAGSWPRCSGSALPLDWLGLCWRWAAVVLLRQYETESAAFRQKFEVRSNRPFNAVFVVRWTIKSQSQSQSQVRRAGRRRRLTPCALPQHTSYCSHYRASHQAVCRVVRITRHQWGRVCTLGGGPRRAGT